MALRPKAPLPPIPARKQIRIVAGITAAEIAAHVGCSVYAVHAWETGKHEPQGANRSRYAEALQELATQSEGGRDGE